MRSTASAIYVAAFLLFLSPATRAQNYGGTGSLVTARYAPTATLLNNGKVLIVGGKIPRSALASAELYDPGTGTFTSTGSMNTTRQNHTATLLANGTVLVVGGANNIGTGLASAEIYDPATGTFTYTGSLHSARAEHTATVLSNGKVLIAGGCCGAPGATLASAELYDPSTGTFSITGSMKTAREFHAATGLANGKVLVSGGVLGSTFLASAELYDPSAGTFSTTGSMHVGRENHTATLLTTGSVLVTGGDHGIASSTLSSAEIYNPASGTFTSTGSMNSARTNHTAALMNDGHILVVGGLSPSGTLSTSELYDPSTQVFTLTSSLTTPRASQIEVVLSNGFVLVAGGIDSTTVLSSAALYEGPVTGYVNPRYVVVGVTYAPPGPSGNTFVNYTNSTFVGTTNSVSNSFMTGTSFSITLTFSGKIPFVAGGSISSTFATSSSETNKTTSSVTMSFQSTTGEKTGGTGSYFAPVNNDYDTVWVWLNPVLIFTVSPGGVIWNGYGVDTTDQFGMDVVGIPLGYLNGDFGAMPPQYATPIARSWAASQTWPSGQGPGLTAVDLAQIGSMDPFSVSTYGTNFIGFVPPSPETADHRFTISTCTSSQSFDYNQAAPSQTPDTFTCTLSYVTGSTQAQEIISTSSQTFSFDRSFVGGPFFSKLNAELKESQTVSWTTDYQSSLTNSTTSTAELNVQGPPCNNVNSGVGPCVPVYDSSGNQPTQFYVYQDNLFGTFMFAPVHYY